MPEQPDESLHNWFTKKSAHRFFDLLRASGAKRIVDVRLNNTSQLARFAKRDDLAYFLKELCGIDYVHLPELAPTQEMLADYRKKHKDWGVYESQFLKLLWERRVQDTIAKNIIHESCLLCSENSPHHCHRRLVADYLGDYWGDIHVTHLR